MLKDLAPQVMAINHNPRSYEEKCEKGLAQRGLSTIHDLQLLVYWQQVKNVNKRGYDVLYLLLRRNSKNQGFSALQRKYSPWQESERLEALRLSPQSQHLVLWLIYIRELKQKGLEYQRSPIGNMKHCTTIVLQWKDLISQYRGVLMACELATAGVNVEQMFGHKMNGDCHRSVEYFLEQGNKDNGPSNVHAWSIEKPRWIVVKLCELWIGMESLSDGKFVDKEDCACLE